MRPAQQLAAAAVVLGVLLPSVMQSAVFEGWGTYMIGVCFISEKAMTWHEADEYCSNTFGTRLASLDTQAKFAEAKSIMLSAGNCSWDTWIGLSWSTESDRYVWRNGYYLGSFERWDEGYPQAWNDSELSSNDTSEEDIPGCVEMLHPIYYRWRNVECGQRRKQILCDVASSRSTESNYHTAVQLKKTSVNWLDGQAFCESYLGTDLASWHSYSEYTALDSAIRNSGMHSAMFKIDNRVVIWCDMCYISGIWGVSTATFLWGSNQIGTLNWTNVDQTRRDYRRWVSGQPFFSTSQQCSYLPWYYYSSSYPTTHLRQTMSFCYSSFSNLICNNENLFWSQPERMVLVQSPEIDGFYEGVDHREGVQSQWTWTQANSYCSNRFNQRLLNVKDDSLMQELKKMFQDRREDIIRGMNITNDTDSDAVKPAWIGLRWLSARDGFFWSDNTRMNDTMEQDSYWLAGFNDSLGDNGLDWCVFMDVNPFHLNSTFGKFTLDRCPNGNGDSLKLFLCGSTKFDYVSYLSNYQITVYNSHKRHNRKQMSWISASNFSGTHDWNTANSICFANFGSSLASIHTNSSDRVANRAAGTASYAGGWIGLRQDSTSLLWSWADGSPLTDFHLFRYYGAESSRTYTEPCASDSTSIYEYSSNYGWTIESCSSVKTYFLCSAAQENWSKRVLRIDDSEDSAEYNRRYQDYLSAVAQSNYGLIGIPRSIQGKYSLLISNEEYGYGVRHREYERWCQKRYNMPPAAFKSEKDVKELYNLLLENNLLFSKDRGRKNMYVFIGGKYDANYGRWFWYDGSEIEFRKLKGFKDYPVRTRGISNRAKECLAVSTEFNEWSSVPCKGFKSRQWICTTPQIERFKHHFRTPMRGEFCVDHWLYALLSVVWVTLNVACNWTMLRLVQYETFLECQDEEMLRDIFEDPGHKYAEKQEEKKKKGNSEGDSSEGSEMLRFSSLDVEDSSVVIGSSLEMAIQSKSKKTKSRLSTTVGYRYKEGLSQNDAFFIDFVNDLLINNWNLPTGVCYLIHEHVGKPTINSWISRIYSKYRWMIVFNWRIGIWAWPVIRLVWMLLSQLALWWMYIEFAMDRHSSWQQYAGFWWIWMICPTSMKFIVNNEDTAKYPALYRIVSRFTSTSNGNSRSLFNSRLIDLYDALYIGELIIFLTSCGIWISTACIGVFVWPWLCLFPVIAMIYADTFYGNNEMQCFDSFTDFSRSMRVDTAKLRRMNWEDFRKELGKVFVHACFSYLTWLFLAVGGIGFWILCTDRDYLKSHSDAWNSPLCDSYFDFDPFSWRAWILLIHWIFV